MSMDVLDQAAPAAPTQQASPAAPLAPAFVHLRVHSEYSIVDGLVRIDDVVAAAAKDKQPALAVTDLANLFGMVKFYKAARGKGIKPIIGVDAWISNDDNRERPSRLLLLAKNHTGYLQLCELLSQAWLTNQYKGRAEIRPEWLAALATSTSSLHPDKPQANGLIVLSGAQFGDIGMALENGNLELAERCARRWAEIFPGHFYIEVQRAGQANQEATLRNAVALAARLGLPVVATHPIQFLSQAEFIAHEARTCIAEGEMLANGKRVKRFNEEMRFKSQAEMGELFADMPAALANSVEIAKRCNVVLTLGKPQLPNFPTPPGMTIDEFLVAESKAGLEQRLLQLYPDEARREAERPRYEARLKFETDTICNMKFPGYFLIVAEFIKWAKENGVPVGPGRGSGAGSLVAYSLLITDLDPLQYNLLFERFLNPERVSMPDFDIDFCQEGRDRVIQYVKDRYGKDAVSQIATFGTMAAKGAIRDVGRVLDFGYNFCDGISKLIPFKPGKPVTIADAIAEEPLLAERLENEDEVKQLLDLAQQVEGIARNIGMHAGGVLIAPGKLTDFCPLYTQGGDSGVVSQYDKDDVEAVGLVKFDFLGLTTLTILDRAVRYIKMLDPAMAEFDLAKLPLDDRASYELLTKAKTVAVFQLESRGMQGMLKDARPDRFEDIIALVALYRPGPMDLIPDFCKRKHGEKFDYPDPRTEGILSETYGIMVYQEQVMQMAQVVGGYSLGGADLLRRARGKKKAEEMAEHRQIFREGAAKKGIDEKKADEVFDLMEKFAGYGFNKSHAAAYSLLAYHTAWLKVHFTAEFFCANMTVEMDDTDKLKVLYEDGVKMGMSFEPPDVNRGRYRFEPVTNTVIRYGLGAVKGTGQSAIEAVVAAREEGGPFKSLFDFALRVDRKAINKRTVEALIKAGAFDAIEPNRAALVASIDRAFEFAAATAANANQGGLFDMFGDDAHGSSTQEPGLVETLPWGIKERLTYEKTAVGFYLSGHLFDEVATEVRRFVRRQIDELADSRDPQMVAGIVSDLRVINGQRGKLAIFKLDDKTRTIEATADEALINANKNLLKDDEMIIVSAKCQPDRFSGGLRLQVVQIWDLASARCRFGKHLQVVVNGRAPDIARLLREHPPRLEESESGTLERGMDIRLQVLREKDGMAVSAELHLGEGARFFPSDAALAGWTAQAHEGQARIVYD